MSGRIVDSMNDDVMDLTMGELRFVVRQLRDAIVALRTPATPDRARAAAEADGLLPCPFCGCKEPSLSLGKMGDGRPFRYVECDGCGAAGAGDPSYTDEQATLQWNRRAPASPSAAAGGEEALALLENLCAERADHMEFGVVTVVNDRGRGWLIEDQNGGTLGRAPTLIEALRRAGASP